MEALEGLAGIVIVAVIVFPLLNIILFFKIWGMTNNVKDIKDILEAMLDLEHPVIEQNNENSSAGESSSRLDDRV